MRNPIKKFFDNYLAPRADSAPEADEHALRLATAALLIEMTRADYKVKQEEISAVAEALRSKFQLTQEESEGLLRLAEEEASQATSYYEFTSLINKGFTPEQKVKVIEHLWQVAFADAEVEKYEESLVRKIADLLYVPHSEFIAAKLKAEEQRRKADGPAV